MNLQIEAYVGLAFSGLGAPRELTDNNKTEHRSAFGFLLSFELTLAGKKGSCLTRMYGKPARMYIRIAIKFYILRGAMLGCREALH